MSEAQGLWVGRFSLLQTTTGELPADWKAWTFSGVERRTEYTLATDEGRTVVQARSSNGASALIKYTDVDLLSTPRLTWSWKTEGPFAGGDWSRAETDDFPLRLFVIFESKKGPFSWFGRLSGRLSRARAINYVFTQKESKPGVVRSPASGRVRMIAVGHSTDSVGAWHYKNRDVLEDYRALFDEDPGRVMAVALMADTDDTESTCVSYFGDIRFVPAFPGGSKHRAAASSQ